VNQKSAHNACNSEQNQKIFRRPFQPPSYLEMGPFPDCRLYSLTFGFSFQDQHPSYVTHWRENFWQRQPCRQIQERSKNGTQCTEH